MGHKPPPMKRIALPFVIGLVVLAGCTASPSASPTTAGPTDASSDPATTAPTTVTTVDDDGTPEATLTPKPCPDRPGTLTNETAAGYASSFEEADAWNESVAEGVRSATVRVTVTNVTESGDGYVVTLDVQASYTEIVTPDGGTPIEQVADDWYDAAYFLNGSTLRRSVARSGSVALDARNGSLVGC